MKRIIWTVVSAAAAVLLLACGSPAAPTTPTFSPVQPSNVVPTSAIATVQPTAVATLPPASVAPAAPSISDGTWTVGEDVPAGTYKVTGAGSTCYWSITKSGSNGADIIDNHLGGGNLRVTLKAGQDFETARCGTWVKQ